MEFTYDGLRPFSICEFQVIAVNNAGQSRPGRTRLFHTDEDGKLKICWKLYLFSDFVF